MSQLLFKLKSIKPYPCSFDIGLSGFSLRLCQTFRTFGCLAEWISFLSTTPLYPFCQLEGLDQLGVQQRCCSQERTMVVRKTSCETFFLNKRNEFNTIYTKKY